MITSFVEGRVRLRHTDLQSPIILEKITKELEVHNGIELVSANRKVGSLLIHYDKAVTKLDEILSTLRNYLQETIIPGKGRKITKRPRNNRLSQISMSKRQLINLSLLVSLAGSLLTLFVNAKTAHIQLGVLFTVVSILHLFDKRKTLLI